MKKDDFLKQLEKDIKSPEFGSGVDDGKVLSNDELEFLDHSNRIEGEYSKEALEDAILAWKYIKKCSCIITLDSILNCHYLLMNRLRSDIAGKWRDCDVWIGGKKKIFISESLIKDDVWFLCDRIQVSDEIKVLFDVPDEAKTRELHIRFEDIHPFEDGNGRTGRIVYNAHRLRLGLPIHIIHEGKEQQSYYRWFR